MPSCKFCGEPFATAANVQKHQSQARDCLKKIEDEFRDITRLRRQRRENANRPPFTSCSNTDFGPRFEADSEVDFQLPPDNIFAPAETEQHSVPVVDWDATPPTCMVEELEEHVYSRKNVNRIAFPMKDGLNPGHAYRLGKTSFQTIRDDEILKHGEVLGPFKDDAEWELAKWLIKNVGHAQADALLKLSIVSETHILRSIYN
jgi:hypothetical protein